MTTPTVTVDANSGEDLILTRTLTSSVTVANPTGGKKGQKLLFRLTQGGTGSNLVTWGSAYGFDTGLVAPTLRSNLGETDLLGFVYNADTAKWVYVARGDHYGHLLPPQPWKGRVPRASWGTAGRGPARRGKDTSPAPSH